MVHKVRTVLHCAFSLFNGVFSSSFLALYVYSVVIYGSLLATIYFGGNKAEVK